MSYFFIEQTYYVTALPSRQYLSTSKTIIIFYLEATLTGVVFREVLNGRPMS